MQCHQHQTEGMHKRLAGRVFLYRMSIYSTGEDANLLLSLNLQMKTHGTLPAALILVKQHHWEQQPGGDQGFLQPVLQGGLCDTTMAGRVTGKNLFCSHSW